MQLEEKLQEEIEEFGDQPAMIQSDFRDMFAVTLALQFALRQPGFPEVIRETVTSFALNCQQHLSVTPATSAFLEAGWNVTQIRGTKCRVCGCTDEQACPNGCHWVEVNLCSACAPAAHSIIHP